MIKGTVIGSRETPAEIVTLMSEYCHQLLQLGVQLRSGGANGADSALTSVVTQYTQGIDYRIYLPWLGFNGIDVSKYPQAVVCPTLDNYALADFLVDFIHSAPSKLSRGARALHARNIYQIRGDNLNDVSNFVFYYAPVNKSGAVLGGTATAVNLAKRLNIPTFNLYVEAERLIFRQIFDDIRARSQVMPNILDHLKENVCLSIGSYK